MYPRIPWDARSTVGEAFRKLLIRSGRRIPHMYRVPSVRRTERPVVLIVVLTLSTRDAGNFLVYAWLKSVLKLVCSCVVIFIKEKESKLKIPPPVLSFLWISRRTFKRGTNFLHVNSQRFCLSPVTIKFMLGLDILLTTAAEDILSIHCHRGKLYV